MWGTPSHAAYGVHVALQHVDERRALLRIDLVGDIEPVDVHRLVAELVGDLFALIKRKCPSLPWSAFNASTDVSTLWSLSTRN